MLVNVFFEKPNLVEQLRTIQICGWANRLLIELLNKLESASSPYPYRSLFELINFQVTLVGYGVISPETNPTILHVPILVYQSEILSRHPHRFNDLIHQAANDMDDFKANFRHFGWPYILIDGDAHERNPLNLSVLGCFDAIHALLPWETWPSYQRHEMPYQSFLQSRYWQRKRNSVMFLDNPLPSGPVCTICSKSDNLHVHHRTYIRRGHELPGDLVILCASCHSLFHSKLNL